MFWEVGNTEDGRTALLNPQSQNSYSYAGNNPIRYSDPTGLWYVETSLSVTFIVVSGTVGLRFNDKGAVFVGSVGAGLGGGVIAPISYSSGDINTENTEVTVSRTAEFAMGPGYSYSRESVYNPSKPLNLGQNQTTNHAVVIGVGGKVSQEYTKTVPIQLPTAGNSGNNSSGKNVVTPPKETKTNGQKLVETLTKLVKVLKEYVKVSKKS